MKIIDFANVKPTTFFAPYNNFYFGLDKIKSVDFNYLSSLILNLENNIVKKYNKEEFFLQDGNTGLGKNSLTSRFAYYNLLSIDDSQIKLLHKEIINMHDTFIEMLDVSKQRLHIQCWANVMRNGEQIKTHVHKSDKFTYLSGHITVQCNIKKNKTSTVYVNPMIEKPHIKEFQTLLEVSNSVGEISIFNSNIPHYTTKHIGKKERITIAFDIFTEDFIKFRKYRNSIPLYTNEV
jgi:hypothetical protein